MKTIDYLKLHAAEIQHAAQSGNRCAQTIIALYQLHYSQPADPGAKGLLDAAVSKYRTTAE